MTDREALEAIVLHRQIPDGESWQQAYQEVTDIALAALDGPMSQYTADENALIAETLGALIGLMEGLCEQVTVDRLRALRQKAAQLAFVEVTR